MESGEDVTDVERAFWLLNDETRIAILRALWAAEDDTDPLPVDGAGSGRQLRRYPPVRIRRRPLDGVRPAWSATAVVTGSDSGYCLRQAEQRRRDERTLLLVGTEG